jgi:lipopolysaccharide transport system ATP-binding protein
MARIASLKEKGATILFVSHSPHMVLQLCDRAVLLENGELLIAGDPKLVVSSYQRFAFSPLEERTKVRADLLALATNNSAEQSEDLAGPTERREETARAKPPEPDFDPALTPQSTSQSLPQGARILETTILDRSGKRVNLLTPRQTYKLALSVAFPQPAGRVRFEMTIKTVEGLAVAGAQSHPQGNGLPFVEASTKLMATFPFSAHLAAGTYFVDVSVAGEIDSRDMELHRVLDATAFSVGTDSERPITGLADISVEPLCEITPFLTNEQATRGRKQAE